jgi:hypothetical protein
VEVERDVVPVAGSVMVAVDLGLSSFVVCPVRVGISSGDVDGGGGKTLGIRGGRRGVLVIPPFPAYIPPLS